MQVAVYILRCADGLYYVGLTRKPVEARVWEHNARLVAGFTASRTPVTLVHVECFDRLDQAIPRERQLKGWSRRKKEALIAGDYESLALFASRRGKPSP